MGFPIKQVRWFWVYLAVAAGLAAFFWLAAERAGESGFPLDDAWIHQTYARRLALNGRGEYTPGQASAGSTAPLWTALLALGYLLKLPYLCWTYALGFVSLAFCGRLAHHLAEQLFPQHRWAGPVLGLFCVGEWHMLWAAASGMETVLFVVWSLALLALALSLEGRRDWDESQGWKAGRRWGGMGVLAALLVLTRPEGVILLALLGLWRAGLTYQEGWPMERRVRAGLAAAIPLALIIGPYLAFNLKHSGGLWPNTFYAKQTEYAAELAQPLLSRFLRVLGPPLTGYQVLLVPGLVLYILKFCRKFSIYLVLLAYPVFHILVYAVRLPVSYQHGRYLIPAVPWLLLCGWGGFLSWIRPRHPAAWRRVLSRAWMAALVLLTLVFVGKGAQAFAKDVQIIQSEMVAVARWLEDNTQPGELVAAHDIGAIGFFAQRPILDLAGLISPQVVALMGDEAELAAYVLSSPAAYLVTAPGWPYPLLTERPGVLLVFDADSPWTAAEGMNSSAVYRLTTSY